MPITCIAESADLAKTPELVKALVKALADTLPNADYAEIEGVGHLPCIEASDQVAEVI